MNSKPNPKTREQEAGAAGLGAEGIARLRDALVSPPLLLLLYSRSRSYKVLGP